MIPSHWISSHSPSLSLIPQQDLYNRPRPPPTLVTLMIATAVYADMFEQLQLTIWLNSDSLSSTLLLHGSVLAVRTHSCLPSSLLSLYGTEIFQTSLKFTGIRLCCSLLTGC